MPSMHSLLQLDPWRVAGYCCLSCRRSPQSVCQRLRVLHTLRFCAQQDWLSYAPHPASACSPARACLPLPALQVIDVGSQRLQNVITFPPSGAFIVDSSIQVEGPQRVGFKFTAAKLKTASKDWGVPPFGQGWCVAHTHHA